jgi:hypothetical protein
MFLVVGSLFSRNEATASPIVMSGSSGMRSATKNINAALTRGERQLDGYGKDVHRVLAVYPPRLDLSFRLVALAPVEHRLFLSTHGVSDHRSFSIHAC